MKDEGMLRPQPVILKNHVLRDRPVAIICEHDRFYFIRQLIAKPLYIDFELICDNLPGGGRVILSELPRPWIGSLMRQVLVYPELLRYKSPILVEPFEFPNEIGKHISVGIHKPVQLITVRR